jgi:DNA-nicking Smr family endonuclease
MGCHPAANGKGKGNTMTLSKSSKIFRPFENLKVLLEKRSIPLRPFKHDNASDLSEKGPEPENDQKLFEEAMADVVPISKDKIYEKSENPGCTKMNGTLDENKPLALLNNLIKYGEGFVVADTPEYVEGVGYHVNPAITKYLHRGDFSIQAHIDLHGLSVEAAQAEFDRFLKEAVTSGKRTILIVHGRGLSSPDKPVLKTKVYQWLTAGPWRKWVLAFASARHCDGGAGATYVLLRQRPFTKRYRKKP